MNQLSSAIIVLNLREPVLCRPPTSGPLMERSLRSSSILEGLGMATEDEIGQTKRIGPPT